MITSRHTVKQVSIKFRTKNKPNKNMGVNIEHNTHNTYENDNEYVPIWKRREMRIHVQIHIHRNWNNKHTDRIEG